jgi:hypothetical protein
MGMLDTVKNISQASHNRLTIFNGKPGSGKTTTAGTFPKPMLYVALDSDGGGEVLKCYSDDDVKILTITPDKPGTTGAKHLHAKVKDLLEELKGPHPYKTVVFDAYSSIEENLVTHTEKIKGKKLNLDERGSIATAMLDLRNRIVELSQGDVEYVCINHVKTKQCTDSTTGEITEMIIPKMSYNNGNILLERASAVIYSVRRTVVNDDGTRTVKFLNYVGAHPNMDTKLRTRGKMATTGMYIEDLTYEKLQELMQGEKEIEQKLNVVEAPTNPFDDENKDEGEE